jgi:metal-responsive CopG/Arc/MetJ family transcriptional regulator
MEMKTAISIPDKMFDAADSLAKKLKLSRSQLYAKAIEEFVAEHAHLSVREKLDQVYAAEPSRMDPSLARAQTAAVGREDW